MVVTPVVTGTSVHLSSLHEVTVTTVVSIAVSVLPGPGAPEDGAGSSVVDNGQ